MQGTWVVVAAEKRGEPAPDDALKQMSVTIKDDTMTIIDGSQPGKKTRSGKSSPREEKVKFKIDPSKTPKLFDMEDMPGIYLFEGDTLKLCWTMDEERPTEFKTDKETGTAMFVLKKGKSD